MKALICDKCQGNEFVNEGSMFVCQFCGTKFVTETEAAVPPNPNFPENMVFARWTDGFFYPGMLGEREQFGDQTQINFLDGCVAMVQEHDILPLEQALQILQMEGNWKNIGLFFKGTLAAHQQPIVMHYHDGDVEHGIEWRQLRGAMPGENPKRNWIERLFS